MKFKKFSQYIEEREVQENKIAHDFDVRIQQFRKRFPDGNGEEVVKKAGYSSIRQFLHDPNDSKWSKLQIPGQNNYVK